MADRPGDDLDALERETSEKILALLDDIEDAVQIVKLYVADALLRPESGGEDGSVGR